MIPTFGPYGGRYAPEILIPALEELEKAYEHARDDADFLAEYERLLRTYVGRPTALYRAQGLESYLFSRFGGTGSRIYLKREDLAHTGAHKINNALGQVLLAHRMGKRRILAETGAGQHGVATATVAALFGLECVIYMGSIDMARQAPNVRRMRLLGAEVRAVDSGSKTLKDAVSEAMREWTNDPDRSHYLLGSALGPHPYPSMVRDFQAIIGREARRQVLDAEGRLPDACIACVGGGSNAIGLFSPFVEDRSVQLIGIEAGGSGLPSGKHAARFGSDVSSRIRGRPGVFQGTYSYVLQTDDGQIAETHSISAGLDYAAVGPEHAWLKEMGRARYDHATDAEALDAFIILTRCEGIIPALESAHAVAGLIKLYERFDDSALIVVNISGRGDKDLETVLPILEERGELA